MQVLFRAEVVGIQNMSNNQAELLTEIDGRYYSIGFYSFLDDEHGITDLNGYYWKVKGNTKSINFDNMIDKNGKKIFASLSEDGVGGDMLRYEEEFVWLTKIDDRSCAVAFQENDINDFVFTDDYNFEVIGIHKG